MKKKIWLSSPHMGGDEIKYVQDAYDTNWIAPLGPNVEGFEEDIVNYTGAKSASALCSGTAAIHIALILLGIEYGDEVICSSFTFSASANPIIYQGATPVFVDSEKDTWNMCPYLLREAIEDRIKKGKKPKAIILVHLYGMPSKMDEIMSVAKRYNIPVIEDAAEALGSKYNNQSMGTFGEIGIYSFNGNKIITTSGGGALVSNNIKHCEKATFLATQSRDQAPHYQHSEIGYNYRMSNILAGIGRGQMKVLDKRVSSRRSNHAYYKSHLESDSISFLKEQEGYFSNRWLSCILTNSRRSREKIRTALINNNIEARPLWKPMHKQPVFKKYPAFTNGVSEELFEKGLCLPSGSNLTSKDLDSIILIIKENIDD